MSRQGNHLSSVPALGCEDHTIHSLPLWLEGREEAKRGAWLAGHSGSVVSGKSLPVVGLGFYIYIVRRWRCSAGPFTLTGTDTVSSGFNIREVY